MKSNSRKNSPDDGFHEDCIVRNIENGEDEVEKHQVNSQKGDLCPKDTKSGEETTLQEDESDDNNEVSLQTKIHFRLLELTLSCKTTWLI